MKYEEFLARVNSHDRIGHRKGQHLYNTLRLYRPDLATAIRGAGVDPFYNNDIIPAALAWIKENWEEPSD